MNANEHAAMRYSRAHLCLFISGKDDVFFGPCCFYVHLMDACLFPHWIEIRCCAKFECVNVGPAQPTAHRPVVHNGDDDEEEILLFLVVVVGQKPRILTSIYLKL